MSNTEHDSRSQRDTLTGYRGIVKSFSFPQGDIRGDTFYIKHLSDNFTVIDCYLKSGDNDKDDGITLRKNEIIAEVIHESEGRVCRFISTHPDNDHIKGIEQLDEKWPIQNFYAVDNDIPAKKDDPSLQRYIELKGNQKMPLKLNIERAWLNVSDETNGSSGITILWPDIEDEKFKKELQRVAETLDDEPAKPNNISCVVRYMVKDGASYLWMGDMETDMQQEFWDERQDYIAPVDIFFHPHHGRDSGKPPAELLDRLDPQIIVIGDAPADHLNYDHPERTITQNSAGDIVFLNDVGMNLVHVYTSKDADNLPKLLRSILGVPKITGVTYRGSFTPRGEKK